MDRSRQLLLAGAFLAVWIAGTAAYPLLESTEGRYASIAGEMARTGRYLEPLYNGELHLDKPPLAYWAGAASIALFGRNEFAVRLPAVLAWLSCVLLVWRIAGALGLSRSACGRAALFAGLSPLAAVHGRMLSADIFLWACVLLAQLAILDRSAPRLRRTVLLGVGIGLGFLAKGPVVLLFTVLPLPFWMLLTRRTDEGRLVVSAPALAVALAIAVPWFLFEELEHPGTVSWWLGREVGERVLTTVHGRTAPWWIYLALLPVLVLPWLPETVRGLRRPPGDGRWRLLVLLVAVPLVVLTLAGSKRSNYLLPAVGPLALLAAGGAPAGLFRLRTATWAALLLAAPFLVRLVPGALPPTRAIAADVRAAGGGPVEVYRHMPSSLSFYLGAPIPGVAVEDLGECVKKGHLIVGRKAHRKEMERGAGRPLEVVAEEGDLLLLRAASP